MAIVGAARSGTTYLAAQLGAHPCIDPGAVKEPNYYSREFERGRSWYDGLYAPSTPGMYRLDASTSLTFPQFPEALGRLAADVNAIARRMAERRREPGASDVLEALELVTRFLGTVRAEVLGTTLTPEGGES